MSSTLYWNVYKALERELLDLSEAIHIDDSQLSVYSMRIANLLIRTVIEIESISKELYFRESGTKQDGKDLYFDTDCIKHLEDKWKLSKKVVIASNPALYLQDNLSFTPLHKASKRGTSSSKWQQAYQGVKHNRAKSLKEGNLQNFIYALGALYLLNLYYQNQEIDLGDKSESTNLDPSLGSSVFSVEIHPFQGINLNKEYKKTDDFERCTYLISPTDETYQSMKSALEKLNLEGNKITLRHVEQDLKSEFHGLSEEQLSKIDIAQRVKELYDQYQIDGLNAAIESNKRELANAFTKGKYVATLNKHEY